MLGVLQMQTVAKTAEASEIQSLMPAFHEFMENNIYFKWEEREDLSPNICPSSPIPFPPSPYRGFGILTPVNPVLQQLYGLAGS